MDTYQVFWWGVYYDCWAQWCDAVVGLYDAHILTSREVRNISKLRSKDALLQWQDMRTTSTNYKCQQEADRITGIVADIQGQEAVAHKLSRLCGLMEQAKLLATNRPLCFTEDVEQFKALGYDVPAEIEQTVHSYNEQCQQSF